MLAVFVHNMIFLTSLNGFAELQSFALLHHQCTCAGLLVLLPKQIVYCSSRGHTSSLICVYSLTYTGLRLLLICYGGQLGPIGQNTRLVKTTTGAWFSLLNEEPLTIKVLMALQLNERT